MWKPTQQPDELYHYGVLGMKWGVHKARKADRQIETYNKKQHQNSVDLVEGRKEYDAWLRDTKINAAYRGNGQLKGKKARESISTKSTAKLRKLNAKYEKRQAKADRMFDKAERKSSSLLASKKSAERAFRKASKAQFKANKAAARGKKWYEQMEKSYKAANISMTKENQEIGKELIRQVRANSRAMYAATYAR